MMRVGIGFLIVALILTLVTGTFSSSFFFLILGAALAAIGFGRRMLAAAERDK